MRGKPAVVVTAVVLVIAASAAVFLLVRTRAAAGPECQIPGQAGSADLALDAVQLQHASTIDAVGPSRGLPERAMVIALATAFQESSMRNLPGGDRDSLGLFQQRPSQGWGTTTQIIDPVYAAGKFYDALVKVPNWQHGPLTEVAQKVQYSGHPTAYAKWEGQARTLAVALGGTVPPDLTCRTGALASTAPSPARDPIAGTRTASQPLGAVLSAAQAELGGLSVQQITDNGKTATVSIAVRNRTAGVAGQALAGWAVAHATSFGIGVVEVGQRRYTGNSWAGATARPAGQVRISIG